MDSLLHVGSRPSLEKEKLDRNEPGSVPPWGVDVGRGILSGQYADLSEVDRGVVFAPGPGDQVVVRSELRPSQIDEANKNAIKLVGVKVRHNACTPTEQWSHLIRTLGHIEVLISAVQSVRVGNLGAGFPGGEGRRFRLNEWTVTISVYQVWERYFVQLERTVYLPFPPCPFPTPWRVVGENLIPPPKYQLVESGSKRHRGSDFGWWDLDEIWRNLRAQLMMSFNTEDVSLFWSIIVPASDDPPQGEDYVSRGVPEEQTRRQPSNPDMRGK